MGVVLVDLTLSLTALVGELMMKGFSQFALASVKVHPEGIRSAPDELMA